MRRWSARTLVGPAVRTRHPRGPRGSTAAGAEWDTIAKMPADRGVSTDPGDRRSDERKDDDP